MFDTVSYIETSSDLFFNKDGELGCEVEIRMPGERPEMVFVPASDKRQTIKCPPKGLDTHEILRYN